MRLRLLVTGTGRCGTAFACQVLRSAGLECGHESIFSADVTLPGVPRVAASDEYDADSSWLATPWLSHPCLEDVRVIHQVRHPIRVMESFLQQDMYCEPPRTDCVRFLARHLPQVRQHTDVRVRAMVHYLLWNQAIETSCPRAVLHRVEDGVWKFLDKVGGISIPDPDLIYNNTTLNSGGRRTAARFYDYPDGEWKERLADYAERLGYDLKELPYD